MEATEGLVGFLDILGYQNFIDNNSVEKAVDILSNVFKGLKEAVVNDYRSTWAGPAAANKRFEDVIIQTLSDTIIFHLATPEQDILISDWMTLLQTVRVTQRRLFDNGFPSRGTVASGKFFFGDGFLVGKPFMDAYRLTQSLEFAGVVLTSQTLIRLKADLKKRQKSIQDFVGGVEFLAPLKDGREVKMLCLCPLRRREIGTEVCRDIAGMVHRAFWQHQKDVPASVDMKINNTIKFWRFWICRKEAVKSKLPISKSP